MAIKEVPRNDINLLHRGMKGGITAMEAARYHTGEP